MARRLLENNVRNCFLDHLPKKLGPISSAAAVASEAATMIGEQYLPIITTLEIM